MGVIGVYWYYKVFILKILIGSQKGGCGKSTISTNLAAALAVMGKDVILIDADQQGSSTNWYLDRSKNKDLAKVNSIQKFEDIRPAVEDLSERYDVVIIDAAGRDSVELRTGMMVADMLIMPIRPSQFDLDTVPNVLDIYKNAKVFNKNLKFYSVITMGPTNPIVNESRDAECFFDQFEEIKLLRTIVRDRKVYRDAICGEGRGVVEMSNVKAKREIEELLKEVVNE